jgi:arylsulfatase A-like enzyme/WD40 repeat protein
MAWARYSHTATPLLSGKVLVTGGLDGSTVLSRAEVYDPATGTWAFTGSMASARRNHTATLLPSGKVLVAGGYTGSGFLSRAEVYDPATGTWASAGSMASARRNHTATLLPSGKVLITGGSSGGSDLASAEVYDPATGTWASTSPMGSARVGHTATLLPSGKVLVAGGYNNTAHYLASAEVYDPATGTWAPTGSLVSPRLVHAATLLPSGKVLVAGGDNAGGLLSSAEVYDVTTGTWASTSAMAPARSLPTMTLLPSGKVLVTGGSGGGGALATVQVYDPATGTWASASSLALPRELHTATLLPSGKVLVAGGYGSSAEVYDPAMGTWASTGALASARVSHTATLLPSGKVLVAGGYNSSFASTEVYDPATGTWASTGAMVLSRHGHTATLLRSGKVLVAGGLSNNPASAEVYDPATGTWASTGAMASGRRSHTATLLPSGKVLVVGGWSGSVVLSSAEVYDPATGTWASTGAMASARIGHTVTLLSSGKVLIAGGWSGSGYLSSTEVYDPETGTWALTGALDSVRGDHTATLLPSGKVLVAGGRDASLLLASARVYDPETGTWASTGALASPRVYHSATLLPSGKVLVAGGVSSGIIASAEVYDPATGAWASTSSLAAARRLHTATLLPSSKVLVAAGEAATGYLASAEVYEGTGALDAWRPTLQPLAILKPGATVNVTGSGFRGVSEASSGNPQGSATNFPLLSLTAVETGAPTRVPGRNFSDTSVTATVPAVPDGYYLLTVTTNAITGGRMVLLDGTPPPVPVVHTPASRAVLRSAPVVSGRAEAASQVTVSIDGTMLGTAVTDASGSWSFTPGIALEQGPHYITAQASDAAGNTSLASSPLLFTVDTAAPPAPVLTAPGAHVNTATPVIAGTAEPGSIVRVSLDEQVAGTATASVDGTWSFTPTTPLGEGAHTATATATDAVGNTSPASTPGAFAVDTVAPARPVVTSPAVGAVVATQLLTVTGTAEAGTTVTVSLDEVEVETRTVTGRGTWSFTPSAALPFGTHTLTARSIDPAGNQSPASDPIAFTITAPSPVPPPQGPPEKAEGCSSAPTAPASWMALVLGLGWLRRRARIDKTLPPPRHKRQVEAMRMDLRMWRVAMLAAPLASCAPVVPRASAPERPNMVFVLIDDLGYTDFSAMGSRKIVTPNIDRIAAEGLVMTQFYVGSPICSPSRAAFTTGRFPVRDGFVSFISSRRHNIEMAQADWLDPRLPTVARALKAAGYATGHFGKWHLGGGRDIGDAPLPADYGFDESYTQFEGLGPRVLMTEDHYGLASQSAQLGHGPIDWLPKSQTTGRYIDKALDFIGRSAGRPWYVQLWLDDVHDPWEPTPEQLAEVRGKGRNADEEKFLAVLVAMDRQFGRLISELERRGALDNTLIVLTGDNGPTGAEPYYRGGKPPPGDAGPHRGRKASLYEGGIRQPLFVRWPGRIPAGRRDAATLASGVDLFPTLAAIAGAVPPSEGDGIDLSEAWRGRPIVRGRDLLFAYGGYGIPGKSPSPHLERDRSPPFAIRAGQWKLLADGDGNGAELYDIEADPSESRNVAGEQPEVTERLKARLVEWRKTLPARNWRSGEAAAGK